MMERLPARALRAAFRALPVKPAAGPEERRENQGLFETCQNTQSVNLFPRMLR